ncbi:MAG: hypothetical protein HY507_00675 [Candidatus Zambryskibacteria bacterium]|nr:hypothetical protein [Candidatus Zambryskibacteria bacterium]
MSENRKDLYFTFCAMFAGAFLIFGGLFILAEIAPRYPITHAANDGFGYLGSYMITVGGIVTVIAVSYFRHLFSKESMGHKENQKRKQNTRQQQVATWFENELKSAVKKSGCKTFVDQTSLDDVYIVRVYEHICFPDEVVVKVGEKVVSLTLSSIEKEYHTELNNNNQLKVMVSMAHDHVASLKSK